MCISEAHTREPLTKHTHDLNSKAKAPRGNAQANIVVMVYAELRKKAGCLTSFSGKRTFKHSALLCSSAPVHLEVQFKSTALNFLLNAVTDLTRWFLKKKPRLGAASVVFTLPLPPFTYLVRVC